jgi:polysaccharide deacetylase 2 family uncharacterized protein YibQ
VPSGENNPRRRTKNRKNYHLLLIFFSLLAALLLMYREFGREDMNLYGEAGSRYEDNVLTAKGPEALPRVAIIIDDLGPSKKVALSLFQLNIPLTFSILPHEPFTRWIAEEAHHLGYEVIGHIPMEAKGNVDPGNGALFTWMSDGEIFETLQKDIDSIPFIRGISNHMGSAAVEDRRVMGLVMSVLKERGMFFLDSLTTGRSVGFRVAEQEGIRTRKRDVFLDIRNEMDYIEAQWRELTTVAVKTGSAVGIAHGKKNTIEFLKKTLPSDEVKLVPVSDLVTNSIPYPAIK